MLKSFYLVFIFLLSSFFSHHSLYAQNLLRERIREIPGHKRKSYYGRGIFFKSPSKRVTRAFLRGIRHSYNKGVERIVFDLSGSVFPSIYGHFDGVKKILSVDFSETGLDKNFLVKGKNEKFLHGIDLLALDFEYTTSVKLSFKKNLEFDIFYLSAPNRLVIDVRGARN